MWRTAPWLCRERALIFVSLLFGFPRFSAFKESFAFLSVFPFFPRDFRGVEETGSAWFFVGFLVVSRKRKERKIRPKTLTLKAEHPPPRDQPWF